MLVEDSMSSFFGIKLFSYKLVTEQNVSLVFIGMQETLNHYLISIFQIETKRIKFSKTSLQEIRRKPSPLDKIFLFFWGTPACKNLESMFLKLRLICKGENERIVYVYCQLHNAWIKTISQVNMENFKTNQISFHYTLWKKTGSKSNKIFWLL